MGTKPNHVHTELAGRLAASGHELNHETKGGWDRLSYVPSYTCGLRRSHGLPSNIHFVLLRARRRRRRKSASAMQRAAMSAPNVMPTMAPMFGRWDSGGAGDAVLLLVPPGSGEGWGRDIVTVGDGIELEEVGPEWCWES